MANSMYYTVHVDVDLLMWSKQKTQLVDFVLLSCSRKALHELWVMSNRKFNNKQKNENKIQRRQHEKKKRRRINLFIILHASIVRYMNATIANCFTELKIWQQLNYTANDSHFSMRFSSLLFSSFSAIKFYTIQDWVGANFYQSHYLKR